MPDVLVGCFRGSVGRFPDRVAVHFGVHRLTYAQLHDAVSRCAAQVAELRPGAGLVGLRLGRTPEYVVAYLAVAALGHCAVPFDDETPDEAVAAEAAEIGVDVMVTHRELAARSPVPTVVVPPTDPHGGSIVWCDGPVPEPPGGPVRPDAPLILLKTSGSTARPRRVSLTNANVLASSRGHGRSVGRQPGEVSLVVLPTSFGYCNSTQIVGQLDAGGTLALSPGAFLPRSFAEAVHATGATTTTVVPSMLTLLARSPQDPALLATLRSIVFGGAPPARDALLAVRRAMPGVELIQTYGQTEAGPRITTLRGPDAEHRPDSVGRAIPGIRLEIRSQDGRSLPPGQTGEVVVRGPGVMAGYHRDPAGTAEVVRSGWLHTGDLGQLDDDGFLRLSGRLRNLIITAGHNVLAEEVEDCLRRAPGVADAAVFGEPDDLRGEIVHAIIVPAGGRYPTPEEIREFAGRRLASYKVPRRVTFADGLPRTATGKVRREGLRDVAQVAR